MRFCLRNYKREDFYTLWEIDQSCFAPSIAYTQFELRSFIHRTTSFTLIAEAGESSAAMPTAAHILGFIIAERASRQGHIITIDVRRETRRLGVGSALLTAAEERLQLWNCPQIRLETAVDNSSALSFYKRHRYSVTKVVPRYYSNGVDALVLEKDLLSAAASANVRK